jgi:hypothetical protein
LQKYWKMKSRQIYFCLNKSPALAFILLGPYPQTPCYSQPFFVPWAAKYPMASIS